jgi:hypothetical protein
LAKHKLYELRLAKYATRGFSVAVAGLDLKRIDFPRIARSNLCDLKGLARIIKIAQEMEFLNNHSPSESIVPPFKSLRLQSEVRRSQDETHRALEQPNCDDLEAGVLLPSVYGDPSSDWHPLFEDDLGGANDTRDGAWAVIEDASNEPVNDVPHLLLVAWDHEKKSREYLNSTMDKLDLDNIYYDQAYEKPSSPNNP